MLFFARGNFLLDNMAVKKNACHEIAASLKKDVGSCWEDSGNCWGKPPGWNYQRKPTPESVGCSF